MAGSTTIDIENNASPEVRAIIEHLGGQPIKAEMGRTVQNRVRNHLRELNSSRANDLGGDRTNFYAKAALQTTSEAEVDGFTVSINKQGIRQRFQGGTITARNGKYLTIPIRAEAYGHRAREFNDLRFAMIGGTPFLIRAEHTAVKFGKQRKDGSRSVKSEAAGGEALYVLKRSVTQRPDPTVLPSEEVLIATALQGAQNFLDRARGASARPQGGSNG